MESHTAMAAEVAPGRLFFGRLRQTADLLESVEAFCSRKRIRAALFSAAGTVLSATFGVFDPSQQVYAVRVEHRPLEIVSCRGSVLPGDDRPRAVAHIVFGDGQAALCGGRLFSETRVDAVEFDVRELVGPLPSRRYDPLTGRMHLRLP